MQGISYRWPTEFRPIEFWVVPESADVWSICWPSELCDSDPVVSAWWWYVSPEWFITGDTVFVPLNTCVSMDEGIGGNMVSASLNPPFLSGGFAVLAVNTFDSLSWNNTGLSISCCIQRDYPGTRARPNCITNWLQGNYVFVIITESGFEIIFIIVTGLFCVVTTVTSILINHSILFVPNTSKKKVISNTEVNMCINTILIAYGLHSNR